MTHEITPERLSPPAAHPLNLQAIGTYLGENVERSDFIISKLDRVVDWLREKLVAVSDCSVTFNWNSSDCKKITFPLT